MGRILWVIAVLKNVVSISSPPPGANRVKVILHWLRKVIEMKPMLSDAQNVKEYLRIKKKLKKKMFLEKDILGKKN